MKKSNLLASGLLVAALASSCSSSKTALHYSALQGDWNITQVNGKAATAQRAPFITLDVKTGRVSGCAGCNRMMGQVHIDSTKTGNITFGNMGCTRMLCPDMETETAILAALTQVARYSGNKDSITLCDKKGHALMHLCKRPDASISSLEGKWTIAQVNGLPVGDIEKTEKAPFINFTIKEQSINGHNGCNLFHGAFITQSGTPSALKFSNMGSTMMAGPGMQVEQAVMKALGATTGFAMKDQSTAVLIDNAGAEVIVLKR